MRKRGKVGREMRRLRGKGKVERECRRLRGKEEYRARDKEGK